MTLVMFPEIERLFEGYAGNRYPREGLAVLPGAPRDMEPAHLWPVNPRKVQLINKVSLVNLNPHLSGGLLLIFGELMR